MQSNEFRERHSIDLSTSTWRNSIEFKTTYEKILFIQYIILRYQWEYHFNSMHSLKANSLNSIHVVKLIRLNSAHSFQTMSLKRINLIQYISLNELPFNLVHTRKAVPFKSIHMFNGILVLEEIKSSQCLLLKASY